MDNPASMGKLTLIELTPFRQIATYTEPFQPGGHKPASLIATEKSDAKPSDVFHLGLTKADLQGAELAIVPGDPEQSTENCRDAG